MTMSQSTNEQAQTQNIYTLLKQKESEQSQHPTAQTQHSTVAPNQSQAQEQSFTAGYQQGYQAGHSAGFQEGIKYAKILDERTQLLFQQVNSQQSTRVPEQQALALDSTSSLATWSSIAQFVNAKDYDEFSKITLTSQQAHELIALSRTSLKSSATARILHFFLGGLGAGYIYLDRSGRAVLHILITFVLILFGVHVYNNLGLDLFNGNSSKAEASMNLLLIFNGLWGFVLLLELFTLGDDTRDTNGQIIRDWLKKENLLADTKA